MKSMNKYVVIAYADDPDLPGARMEARVDLWAETDLQAEHMAAVFYPHLKDSLRIAIRPENLIKRYKSAGSYQV